MTPLPYPMKLTPRLLEKPWGGDAIRERYGKGAEVGRKVGESWELYDRPDGASRIANGAYAGKTVSELRGDEPLPLLTKIIDARETLSVQVHPDAEAAEELGGEPKTEAWYVLSVADGGRIYKGLEDGVRAPALISASREGVVEECHHSFTPEPGDVVFLPSGTVHAIGGGVMLFEVQQNSDTTYRLYDWGRTGLDGKPRDLHLHEAIRSTDFSGRGLDIVSPRTRQDDGRHRRTERVACPHFILEEHELLGLSTYEKAEERFEVVFLLDGEGSFRPFHRGVEEVFVTKGDTLLLPAEYEEWEICPRPGMTLKFLAAREP